MELARLIPRFQALPELLVFRCPHCEHVETIEQPRERLSAKSSQK
jgi:hypothetical protein